MSIPNRGRYMNKNKLYSTLLLLLVVKIFTIANTIQWHRGQIHCHSTVSDGDVPPSTVFSQYKGDGYSFVCLTDHSTNTKAQPSDTNGFNSEDFLAIPGLEITAAGPHVNAINLESNLAQWWGLQIAIDNAYKSGADLVQLNHPWWSNSKKLDGISDDALKAKNNNLLEVCNADDTTHIPDIAVWDTVLSTGRRIFGTGTDDAHDYSENSKHYNECWITVPGDNLSVESMMNAMKSGDFYFNDKEMPLKRIDMYDRTLAVYSDEGTEVKFIGKYGEVLKTVEGSSASYTLAEGGLYVRAEVTNGVGTAYTQAHFPSVFNEKGGNISAPGGQQYKPGSNIEIDIEYLGSENMEGAKLYANNSYIGEISSRQENYIWSTNVEDDYVIKAKIISEDGTYLWSNPLNITVDKTTPALQQHNLNKSGNVLFAKDGTVSLTLAKNGHARVNLVTLSGRKISTIVSSYLPAGIHTFSMKDVNPNSVYILKARVCREEFVQKVMMK